MSAGFAHNVDVVIGGRATLAAARRIAATPHPREGLYIDAFKLHEPSMVRAVEGAARRGPVGVLLDPEFTTLQSRDQLARLGASLVEYAPMPGKNHGKSLVGQRGMVTSVPFTPAGPLRTDFGVALDPAGSEALRDLMRTGLTRDRSDIRGAALVAREHGILLNDRINRVEHLADYLDEQIADSDTLLVASKRLDDSRSERRLARSARGGSDVTLITKDIERDTQRRLERAGVRVRTMPTLHGNAMVFDGRRGYVGSAYLHDRSLGRDGRPTREVGIAFDDPRAVRKLEADLTGAAPSAWQQARDWFDRRLLDADSG